MITANSWFECNWDFFVKRKVDRYRLRFKIPATGYDDGEPLPAHINHGNWLVRCPCGGYEYVWEEGWVFCFSCANNYIGHKFRKTTFPSIRAEIEGIMKVRPLHNRNWNLGETLDDLRKENEEHASELLVGGG